VTRAELERRLDEAGVSSATYDLTGTACEECLRLERTADGWIVYYAERGLRTGERYFRTESEACEYVASELLRDPTTRQHR